MKTIIKNYSEQTKNGLPDFSQLHKITPKTEFSWKGDGKYLLKRAIKIGVTFIILLSIYCHYFTYIDFSNGCYINIKPAILTLSNTTIKSALGEIKKTLPDEYFRICQRVGTINPNFSCGGFGGGCFVSSEQGVEKRSPKDKAATIDVSTNMGDVSYSVDVIVHETCHAYQFYESRPFSEEECYKEGDKAYQQYTGITLHRDHY